MRAIACAILAASVPAAAVAAEGGFIKGKLSPPERAFEVRRVVAIDRDVTQKITARTVKVKEFEAAYEPASGEFTAGPLPEGTYDLLVEFDGGKLEGVDLRGAEKSEKELGDSDRKKISELVQRMKTWSNWKRTMAIGGNGKHATALVELLRTEKTSYHGKKKEPFVVWRVELWHYLKLYGTWRREDDPKVLRRFMIDTKDFAKWTWNFEPGLGGIDVKAGEAKRVDFELPAAFTTKMGRVNGRDAPAGGAAAQGGGKR